MIVSGKTPRYDISVFPHLAHYKRNRSDRSVVNKSNNWKNTFDAHQCSDGALQASHFKQDHKTSSVFWKTTLFICSTYIIISKVTSVDPQVKPRLVLLIAIRYWDLLPKLHKKAFCYCYSVIVLLLLEHQHNHFSLDRRDCDQDHFHTVSDKHSQKHYSLSVPVLLLPAPEDSH